MLDIVRITLLSIFRDRVFQGIMTLAILFLFVPAAASLSMRQVTELSITFSLSLLTFIMLLVSVFLGGTSIWRDIERRYVHSVLSLPVSRGEYLLGRFLGLALFLILISTFLGGVAGLVVKISSGIYPSDRLIVWSWFVLAIIFATLKYILLIAVALLLSTVSTSFFLPLFGTICSYLVSSFTQQVYEYVHSPAASQTVSATTRFLASVVYYLLPNLAGFDLKINAIYGVAPNMVGLCLTLLYFFSYVSMLLGASILLFNRREML